MAKRAKKKATAATANENADAVNEDEEAAAAAAAEQEAMEAVRNEKLSESAATIGGVLGDIQAADKDNAVQVRKMWVDVGNELLTAQAVFISPDSNKVDDKAYGQWIKAEGWTAIGQRAFRASVVWLAKTYNEKPDLYALIPSESTDGEPLRRSPRTIQDWVRSRVYETFQEAFETDSDSVVAPMDIEDKNKRDDIAEETMPNVMTIAQENLALAKAGYKEAKKALDKAKNKAERDAAMSEVDSKGAIYDRRQTNMDILNNHSNEERLDFLSKWKPKRAVVAFKDKPVDEAAEQVFALLKRHEEFAGVYAALGRLVDDHQKFIDDEEAERAKAEAEDDGDIEEIDAEDELDMEEELEDFDDDEWEDDDEDEDAA